MGDTFNNINPEVKELITAANSRNGRKPTEQIPGEPQAIKTSYAPLLTATENFRLAVEGGTSATEDFNKKPLATPQAPMTGQKRGK